MMASGLAVLLLSGCAAPATIVTPTARASVVPAPTPEPPSDPIAAFADDYLAGMTNSQKIASMLMLHLAGTDGAALGAFAHETGGGGLILMGDNVPADESLMTVMTGAMQFDPQLPLLVAIDQEGGWVSRLDSDTAPGADELKFEPVEATTAAFTSRGALLKSIGINLNFGIVADVTADPDSFIYERVLGTDPAGAADRVSAAVTAERGLVASTIKHFPGHGSAPGDSHSEIPGTAMTAEQWGAGEAIPFRAGIAAGTDAVMFGHLSYSAVDPLPASLSPSWHQVLRTELGFTGVTITDDMLMLQHADRPEFADPYQNAVAAVAAGNDMLLYVLPSDPSSEGINISELIGAIEAAVVSGSIPQQQIDDSAWRLLYLRHTLAAS